MVVPAGARAETVVPPLRADQPSRALPAVRADPGAVARPPTGRTGHAERREHASTYPLTPDSPPRSGYADAILAELGTQIYAIERIEQLAKQAAGQLDVLGYRNAHVRAADGSLGWLDEAPFDAIVVSAGAPSVPESLKAQLAVGGRLVIPIGRDAQELARITRVSEHEFERGVVDMLLELQARRLHHVKQDRERFLDAAQNARLVANAERYYRIMYYGSRASWNLRDTHMYETLDNVMRFHGSGSKACPSALSWSSH